MRTPIPVRTIGLKPRSKAGEECFRRKSIFLGAMNMGVGDERVEVAPAQPPLVKGSAGKEHGFRIGCEAGTWATPRRVDRPHAADESDQFEILPGSTTPPAGLPSPEHSESGSLPADNSLRPEDHQRNLPIRPSSLEHDPEPLVPRAKFRPVRSPFEHRDLVSQGENFHDQFVLRAE